MNTKRIFAEIIWYATDSNDAALKTEYFVGAAAPNCHMIIDSVNINIGECALDENTSKSYPLLAKMGYFIYYSEAARNTLLQ